MSDIRFTARSLLAVPLLAVAVALPYPSTAQPPGFSMPVAYTEAVNHDIRRTLELTGSIESRRASIVASEVEGLVIELSAREGQAVHRGQPLAKLRRETAEHRLESVEGQLKEAKARLELAESRRARAQGLFDEQVISQSELDDALTEVEANDGRVSQLTAEAARLVDELERTTIRAPFSGVVVAEHTAVGQWIGSGGAVAELVDVRDLEVTLAVPESFFGGLTVGTRVEVLITSLPGRMIEGTVRSVVPRADPQARTFPVKVRISNDDGKVGVGMLARVRLPIGEAQPAVLVPKDAIVNQGSRRLVFALGEDSTVTAVDVRTGESVGGWIAVEGEVAAGDRVITQGNERLQPGMQVNAQPKVFEVP